MISRKLYLVINDYDGDLPFILFEVGKLCEEFDVSIICVNGRKENEEYLCTDMLFFNYSGINAMLYAWRYLFNNLAREETKRIIRENGSPYSKVRCLISSVRAFSAAEWFRRKFHHIVSSDYDGAIIYTFWCDFPMLAFLEDKKMYPNCKYISRIHGYDLYDERVSSGRQPFKWYINENINKLVFIAKNGMDYYLGRHKDLVSSKAVLYRMGVPPIAIEKKFERTGSFLLLSCSNLIPLKRVELIIRALAGYDGDYPIEWTHYGDGSEKGSLMALADRMLSNRDNVSYHFAGAVSNQEIRDYYVCNEVGCFITTSSTEGAPVSLMEAFSAGVPVVATGVGDIPNMVKGNGILLSSNPSIREVIDAIDSIVDSYLNRDNSNKYNEMCENSLKVYNEMYRSDINTERFIKEVLLEDRDK